MLQRLQSWWMKPFFWVIGDAILINIAFVLAYYIRYELQWLRAVDPANDVSFTAFMPFAGLLTLVLLLAYRQEGIYRPKRRLSWFDEVYAIFNGTTTGILLMIVIVFINREAFYSRIIFLYTGALILILLAISRGIKVTVLDQWRKQGFNVQRLLIIGAGEVARTMMRAVVANPELGYNIVGFIDDNQNLSDIGRFSALGNLNNLPNLLIEKKINEVIITLPWQHHRKIMNIIAICERHGCRARIVPDVFQMTLGHMEMTEMAGIPILGVRRTSIRAEAMLVKRIFDIIFALSFLMIFSPLFGLIALLIKLDSLGPIFFQQCRIGKDRTPFQIYKFRSMVQDAEAQKDRLTDMNEADGLWFKIKDDPRRTRVGRVLRKLSLDEFPQFYNVLRGEMSVVGPRPNLPSEVEGYQAWHERRLEVKPGITGLWAIHGRSALTFDEMVLLDLYYIENWSFALDIKIMLQTIPRLISGSGAY